MGEEGLVCRLNTSLTQSKHKSSFDRAMLLSAVRAYFFIHKLIVHGLCCLLVDLLLMTTLLPPS